MIRGLARLLFLGLLLCAAPARALPEDTWVVAIGNNAGQPEEVQLLYAERDARELADVLRTQGAVPSDRVRLVLGEDAHTARRTIEAANATIRARLQDGPRPTALIVFYSGHADAAGLHLGRTQLPMDELRSLLAGSPASMRLLVVDACRSGQVTRVKGVRAAPEFAIRLEDRVAAEGMAIIASSTAGESSQESDRLRGSFFSHHLVNALRGAADQNGDGRVTLQEAYAYTYAETLRSSGTTLTLQHPTYAYDVKGSGDLVLTTAIDVGRGTGRLRLPSAGLYLVTEEREGGPVIAELRAQRDGAFLTLPRGRYFVQQRAQDEYREFEVDLGTGETVDVGRLPYRGVRYDRLVRKRGGAHRSAHGLLAMAGVRGEVLAGEGPTPNLVLGYNADLPWLTVGARLRGATVSSVGIDGGLPRRHSELSLGVVVQRFIDLPWLSVSFGLLVEGVYHAQTFSSGARLPVGTRQSLGFGFTGLLAAERHLWRGLAARLEVGPTALLQRQAVVEEGVQVRDELRSSFTYYAAGGLLWRI